MSTREAQKSIPGICIEGYLWIMIWSSPEEKLCSREVGIPWELIVDFIKSAISIQWRRIKVTMKMIWVEHMKMILIMLYFCDVLLPCWSLWGDQGPIASRKFLTKELGFKCAMECNFCGHLRREGESPHDVKSREELTMSRFQSKLDVHCKPYSTTLAVW